MLQTQEKYINIKKFRRGGKKRMDRKQKKLERKQHKKKIKNYFKSHKGSTINFNQLKEILEN